MLEENKSTRIIVTSDTSDFSEASSNSNTFKKKSKKRKRISEEKNSPDNESEKKKKMSAKNNSETEKNMKNKRRSRRNGSKCKNPSDFSAQLTLLLDSTTVKEEEKKQSDTLDSDLNEFLNDYFENINSQKGTTDANGEAIDVNRILNELKLVKSDIKKTLNVDKSLSKRIQNIEDKIESLSLLVNKQEEIIKNQQNSINEMNATIKEIFSKKNDFIGKKSSLKNNFHIIDENGTLLKEAKDEYIKEKILEMRKRQFGPNCLYEIKNKQLREFLEDEEIKNKALSYIKDSGKFCKFVADILLPKNALLKYYFPSEKTRRPIEQLFNDIIVQCYNITAKYLGLGIVAEEKHYLSYGIHLLNTRTYDKIARKANVLFYTLEHKPTFFSMEHVKPQSESEGDDS